MFRPRQLGDRPEDVLDVGVLQVERDRLAGELRSGPPRASAAGRPRPAARARACPPGRARRRPPRRGHPRERPSASRRRRGRADGAAAARRRAVGLAGGDSFAGVLGEPAGSRTGAGRREPLAARRTRRTGTRRCRRRPAGGAGGGASAARARAGDGTFSDGTPVPGCGGGRALPVRPTSGCRRRRGRGRRLGDPRSRRRRGRSGLRDFARTHDGPPGAPRPATQRVRQRPDEVEDDARHGLGRDWNWETRTRETSALLTGTTRRRTSFLTPGQIDDEPRRVRQHEVLGGEDAVAEQSAP